MKPAAKSLPAVAPPPEPAALDASAAAARTAAGLVLLLAGAHMSFAAPEEFAAVVERYRLVPQEYLLGFAWLLPAAEVLIGTALVLGWRARPFCAAAGGCFLMFIAALGSTKARGIPLEDCGCFGKGIHLKPSLTMALDSVLMGLSYWGWRRPRAFAWLDAWIERGNP